MPKLLWLFKYPSKIDKFSQKIIRETLGGTRPISGQNVMKALHVYALDLIIKTLAEIGVLKYVEKMPRTKEDIENHCGIRRDDVFGDILEVLTLNGVLEEAGGRFRLKRELVKKPKFLQDLKKEPSISGMFEVLSVLGSSLADVLLSGTALFDWEKDAALAWEALEVSYPFTLARLFTIEHAFKYIAIRRKTKVRLGIVGTSCGWAIANAYSYFRIRKKPVEIVGLEFSERAYKLSQELIHERDIPSYVLHSEIPEKLFEEEKDFDIIICFHHEYLFTFEERRRIINSLKFKLKEDGALLLFSFTRYKHLIPAWDIIFKTIRNWKGLPDVEEHRSILRTLFMRVKEKSGGKLVKAEYPL